MKGQAIRRHGQIIGLTNPNLSLMALRVTAYYKAELCRASKESQCIRCKKNGWVLLRVNPEE